MPPRGGFKGCLLPSAKDVVLGRPLIIFQSKFPIISQAYHISRWHPSSDRVITVFFYTFKHTFIRKNVPYTHPLKSLIHGHEFPHRKLTQTLHFVTVFFPIEPFFISKRLHLTINFQMLRHWPDRSLPYPITVLYILPKMPEVVLDWHIR